jgi:hypothetical protein
MMAATKLAAIVETDSSTNTWGHEIDKELMGNPQCTDRHKLACGMEIVLCSSDSEQDQGQPLLLTLRM